MSGVSDSFIQAVCLPQVPLLQQIEYNVHYVECRDPYHLLYNRSSIGDLNYCIIEKPIVK